MRGEGPRDALLQLELSLAYGERLRVERVAIREAVSSLFSVEAEASSPEPCVDLEAIAGQPAALRIEAGEGSGLFGMGLRTDYRIYQHLSVPEIGRRAGSAAPHDHDFVRPTWALVGRVRSAGCADARTERHRYRPGACVVERDGAAWHDDRHAEKLAMRALEAELTGACAT